MTQYPLYKRIGGPQGRSGRLRNISSSPGCDPRTVKPVASRYTDYAISIHAVAGNKKNVGFEVMIDLLLKTQVLWGVTLCQAIDTDRTK